MLTESPKRLDVSTIESVQMEVLVLKRVSSYQICRSKCNVYSECMNESCRYQQLLAESESMKRQTMESGL